MVSDYLNYRTRLIVTRTIYFSSFFITHNKKVNVGYTIGDIYFIMILVSEVIYRYKELIKNGIYNNDKK